MLSSKKIFCSNLQNELLITKTFQYCYPVLSYSSTVFEIVNDVVHVSIIQQNYLATVWIRLYWEENTGCYISNVGMFDNLLNLHYYFQECFKQINFISNQTIAVIITHEV